MFVRPEDGRNYSPKHVELIEIINKIIIVASSWLFILLYGRDNWSLPVERYCPGICLDIVTKYTRNLGQNRSLATGFEAGSPWIAIRRVAAVLKFGGDFSHYWRREVTRYCMIVMKWCRAICEEWKWTSNFKCEVPTSCTGLWFCFQKQ